MNNDFIESYLDAWNRHDPKQIADHLSHDGIYLDMSTKQHLAKDEFIEYLKDYFRQDNNHYTIVGEVLAGERTISFQYRECPLDGDHPEDQYWMGAEFLTVVGGTAVRIENYYSDTYLARHYEGSGQRYAKSGLSAAGLYAVTGRLSVVMEEERMFMDPQLSLPQLAERLSCSVNHLSQAINEGHGVSFFDYINRYRVLEATSILKQKTGSASSILDVALAVGFNSTSTFYAAFKKTTGQTPAQFRRESAQS
ncbi:MAG: AraC-like DNA-binding protein [Halieaceae bacterium]|jgi:AraC-like DNA-binding protein